MSYDNALIQPFENVFGIAVEIREKILYPENFSLDGKILSCAYEDVILRLKSTNAKILLADLKNNPLLTCNKYGKGQMLFLNAPLEKYLSDSPNIFNQADEKPYWKLYAMAAKAAGLSRIIASANPQIGVTEHFISENEAISVLINYSPFPVKINPLIGRDWKLTEIILGNPSGKMLNIDGNNAIVVRLSK
jgi:hypothetical protein